MTGKGCLHSQMCKSVRSEKECTFSSWGDTEMCTSDRVANLQRMLTEINESGAITKVIILVEKDTGKHLKTFRIIFGKMSLSPHVLCWWQLSADLFREFS